MKGPSLTPKKNLDKRTKGCLTKENRVESAKTAETYKRTLKGSFKKNLTLACSKPRESV